MPVFQNINLAVPYLSLMYSIQWFFDGARARFSNEKDMTGTEIRCDFSLE